jgi:hypothetical protein
MGVMRTILGLIMIAAILVIVGVLLLRRRGRDEIHSIDHYRHALDTLQEMRGPAGSSVRILTDDEVRELRKPTPLPVIRTDVRAPVPPRIPAPPEGRDGMVFDEAGQPTEEHSLEPGGRGHLHHENPSWAINRMENRRPLQSREIWAAVGALVVLLVLIVVGVVIGRSSSGGSHASSTSTSRPHTTTTKPATTTTQAAPASWTPVAGGSATAASYQIPGSSYTVTVTGATGDCWTVATSASGSQVFAGSIAQGASQDIMGASGLSVTLGAPGNVTVKVNGVPVTFPTSFAAPLVLTFVSPPPPTTTTTTTTSAPSTTTTTTPPTTQLP